MILHHNQFCQFENKLFRFNVHATSTNIIQAIHSFKILTEFGLVDA